MANFSKKINRNIKISLLITIIILIIQWAVFLINEGIVYDLRDLGLKPRTLEGLIGILSLSAFAWELESPYRQFCDGLCLTFWHVFLLWQARMAGVVMELDHEWNLDVDCRARWKSYRI